ncbi:hypothetical protein D0C36_23240 [Mucilaginibacter conchicola]|uniref:Uncharacterized protein n=1 Tax=Mucilaginibacter conchicola TaxID=2303333 RepID=A0A372NMT6_9SPHI|nr:hypothetical protein [Mucilaginibacter conchicola]RFZ90158.1 hypothetical protein D0C36_23240 [Mucilaginibacter conchicola]
MNRDKVIATVNDMPTDFDLDTLVEKLIFIEKVEKGLQQADQGDVIPHGDVKQLVKTWSK